MITPLTELDPAAAYGMEGKPFIFMYFALFVIVLLRSHGTYWVARGAIVGGMKLVQRRKERRGEALSAEGNPKWVQDWQQTGPAARAQRFVNRWGPVAVFLCYFTIGFQSAVLITCGLARMNYTRFTIASIPGSLGWAAIWSTVGLAAVWGAIKVAGSNWWVLLLGVGVVVALILVARKRRRPAPSHSVTN